jgi:Zn-dependent metalloprotease
MKIHTSTNNIARVRLASLTVLVVFLGGNPSIALPAPLRDQTLTGEHERQAMLVASRLGPDHTFVKGKAETDDLGMSHVHFLQYYRGVRVFGGEIITHVARDGNTEKTTDASFKNLSAETTPLIKPTDAILKAAAQRLRKAAYTSSPTPELIVYPIRELAHVGPGTDATSYEYRALDSRLAYLVSIAVESMDETSNTVYVVDARSGSVIDQWDDLQTAGATGSGNSEYSGTVQINTNSIASGFELRDLTRGTTAGPLGVGNVVTDLAHATAGNGAVYTNSTNVWGDGLNYASGSTTSPNGQTAAVDAAFGAQVTWDLYKNVFGRNGIDGNGKATYSRVHYSSSYDNAAWAMDGCFCMTYGDGSQYKVLTSLDVAGHELSHGVTQFNGHGGLTYSGESGGLNESNSDVMGTMAEFYSGGGGYAAHSTTVPTTGGNWTIGEQLRSPPLRYMYKPSKDGSSPDSWNSSIGSLDVHYSSGPGNRQFYFLSQGASSNSTSDFYSAYLPGGMSGVGNDHAARIHYRALTTYYTSGTTYAAALTAHNSAAIDLYGNCSPEQRAVVKSFLAINVGSSPTTCDAPQNFRYSVGSNSPPTLVFNWTPPIDLSGPLTYFLECMDGAFSRCAPGNTFHVVWSGTTTTASFAITAPGSTASFRVRARTSAGTYGSYSTVITVQL